MSSAKGFSVDADSAVERPAEPPRNFRAAFSHWAPPVLWIAMIAVGSTEQLSAQHTSTALDYLIRFLGAHVSHLDVLDAVLRKVGHFLVYGTLGLLLFRAWRYSVPAITRLKAIRFPQPAWTARWSLLAIAGAVLVAALDEFHQSFVPSRTSSIRDVALDAMGAAFFQLFLLALLYGKSQKISRH